MSRFFAGGSDSESESSSDDEQIIKAPQPVQAPIVYSDDEEVKRVVRSAKEKRFEELSNIIKNIRNYKKIKDIGSILSSFEELTKAYAKAQPVIQKEENGVIPKFVIRSLAELEDFINQTWDDKDGRKNMSKNNGKSLGTLRQKFRKYIKDFESDIKKFRESPDADGDDDDEMEEKPAEPESSSDDDEKPIEKAAAFKKEVPEKVSKPKPPKDDEDSDDSIDWGDSDDDSTSSSDEYDATDMRTRFLKDKVDKDDVGKQREKKVKAVKQRKEKELEDDGEGEWETVPKYGTSEKPKMFAKDAEIDLSVVLNKLSEVMAARGKKKTDRKLQIEFLQELKNVAEQHNLGPAIAAKVRFSIVSAIFDYNLKISEPMKLEYWSKLLEVMNDLMKLLLTNAGDVCLSENVTDETEEYETKPYRLRGCVLTAVERLDDEFIKLLKECDPHSNEYVERLKDEVTVTKLIEQVLKYVEIQGSPIEICRVYLRKIDHLYYKFDPNVLRKRKGQFDGKTSVDEMEKLCHYIYSHDNTDRLRTRAILSHIFHHALHDNWFQARDLVLMSHLQETIQHSDPSTQILFNRTMANLGLCAFRQGNIKDAHQCLIELMMTAKPKELLAQGLIPQRQHERSLEQEKIEKQRQIPFHMHINLELLECVYLVSAMLLEIPYMAAHEFDARRRMISKTFYQQLRSSERQSLVGPPESMREHVVAASKAMRHGDWKSCAEYIVNKKMNTKVWDLFYESDRVRDMLVKFIKEESLRTYLFTYSNVYGSISVAYLAEMFDLPKMKVHSIISKMIINEELMASLDDPTETVVMHRSEPSRLQALSMQLADKITNLVDANERIFEAKQPNFFQRNQYNRNQTNQQGGYNRQQNQQNWNNNKRQGQRNRKNVSFQQQQQQQQNEEKLE